MGVITEPRRGPTTIKDNSGNIVELQPYHTYLVNGKDVGNFRRLEGGVGTRADRTVYFDNGDLGADQIITISILTRGIPPPVYGGRKTRKRKTRKAKKSRRH
jgi:hypothetical protein